MKINKFLFFLPLSVVFSLEGALNTHIGQSDFIPLYNLDSAAPAHGVNWKLVFQHQPMEQEFALLKASSPEVANSFEDFKNCTTSKTKRANDLLLSVADLQSSYPLIIQFLLDNGAEVNTCNNYGWTPLHWAAHQGNAAVVKLLLKKGANVNASVNSSTPLHMAALSGHATVVQLLLTAKTTIHDRQWLIDRIRRRGHTNIVALLELKESSMTSEAGDA